jgi:hypothetical protein
LTVILTAAIAITYFSEFPGSLAQLALLEVLDNHSQRSLRANPKNLRSRTPRPLKIVDRQTTG